MRTPLSPNEAPREDDGQVPEAKAIQRAEAQAENAASYAYEPERRVGVKDRRVTGNNRKQGT
jgi:hypothetical protein